MDIKDFLSVKTDFDLLDGLVLELDLVFGFNEL